MTPIAIVGIGCVFPKAEDKDAYWANVRDGVDAITDVPPSHWDPAEHFDPDPSAPDRTYGRRGGFLDSIELRPLELGVAPRDLPATDTSQLLGLHAAAEALRDAGYGEGGRAFDRSRAAVILGVTGALELVIPLGARLGHPIWRRALREAGVRDDMAEEVVRRIGDAYVPWQESSFPGLLGNVVAGRIANRLDLHGTNCVVDAACASSLSALHLAALELETSRADLVLAGGVDTFNDVFMYTCFSKTPALSPTQDARPFARDADGTVLGEGVGVLVLRRLADAQRDGDRIYAVVRGIGTSSDGKGKAIYAPDAAGQARALRSAYALAGIDPRTVGLVEAHGTGTKVGDATEAAGLCEVFAGAPAGACALGSVKSMIGHTKAAAGVAGLIKAALALHRRVLPPTLKVEAPAEALASGQTPFYVARHRRPWIRGTHPRRAGVSAFGFGGSNFHCVLEEHDERDDAVDWSGQPQIVAVSGSDREGLVAGLRRFAGVSQWSALRRLAGRSREAFDAGAPWRCCVVIERGASIDAAIERAEKAIESGAARQHSGDVAVAREPAAGGLAALFPGQGTQYAGMLRDLACAFGVARGVLAQAERAVPGIVEAIHPHDAFADPRAQAAALRATEVAQPALGAVSLGAWRVLETFGVRLQGAVGHSYGELVALVAAGSLPEAALPIVSRRRGELMALGKGDRGTMLAVAAELATMERMVVEHGLDVTIANRNGPRQVVLSGTTASIEAAAAVLATAGVATRRLDVAAAFHSPLVAAARGPFLDALAPIELATPAFPVYANATGSTYPAHAGAIRALLAEQLASPVEFVRCVQRMWADGVRTFVELGPGRRLCGLVNEILGEEAQTIAIDASSGKRSGMHELARVVATLAAFGHGVELRRWDPEALVLAAPDAKPTLTISVCGANPKPKREREPMTKQPATVTLVTEERPVHAQPRNRAADGDHVSALIRLQEQTADLHRRFLEGQQEATRLLASLIAGRSDGPAPSGEARGLPAAPRGPEPVVAGLPVAPRGPEPVVAAPPVAPRGPEPVVVRLPGGPSGVGADAIAAVLIEVVADKTGYPVAMLDLSMGLDADLGIDSIKRVEILSALGERLPSLPTIGPEHLGELLTLQKIVEHLAGAAPVNVEPPAPAPTRSEPGPAPRVAAPTADVARVLLEVVADKTGYPVAMLELSMGLDADLGIDSIKRVEILSALAERLPDAPIVGPEKVGELQTLAEVAAYLEGGARPTVASRDVAPQAIAPQVGATRLQRHVLRWRSIDVPAGTPRLPACVLVAGTPGDPFVDALQDALHAAGCDPVLTDLSAPRFDPRARGLVIVASTRGDAPARAAFRLVRDACRSGGLDRLVTVSRLDGRFAVDGLHADADPIAAALAGLAKTVAHEWSACRCHAFDVDPGHDPTTAARTLVTYLDAPEIEIGLTREGAGTLALVREDEAPARGRFAFGRSDVVLVTGGARGVTASVAEAIAAAGAKVVLVGRSPEPGPEPAWLAAATDEAAVKRALLQHEDRSFAPRELGDACARVLAAREIRATLARIGAAGGTATYRAADVRDGDAVAALVRFVERELGPVTALVHGAGVLADRKLVDKRDEDFDAVWSTKVDGARALLSALDRAPLRAVVMFSSSTARFGRVGQADYAMANAALDGLAQAERRRRPDARVLSLAFGPWEAGMVTPALRDVFAREGIDVIPLRDGAAFVLDELARGGPTQMVVLGAGSRLPAEPSHAPESSRSRDTAPPSFDSASARLDEELPTVVTRTIDVVTHPVLGSHVIGGRAVVPTVLALEWLAHAALHGNPGLRFAGADDLRILKGIRLGAHDRVALRFSAGPARREGDAYVVATELCSGGGNGRRTVHARARIVLAETLPPAPAVDVPTLAAHPASVDEIYRDVLFHGEALHALTDIVGLDATTIVVTAAAAPSPRTWMDDPPRGRWIADPMALDAGLQAVVVWSHAALGVLNLPARVERLRIFAAFPRGGTTIVARADAQGRHEIAAALDFLDDAGRLVAQMDCVCTLDAALADAFADNALAGDPG